MHPLRSTLTFATPMLLNDAMHLLMRDRLDAIVLYLPSGTLSVLRAPCSRGSGKPPSKRRSSALQLASSVCALFWVAWRCRVPAVLACGGMSFATFSEHFGFLRRY